MRAATAVVGSDGPRTGWGFGYGLAGCMFPRSHSFLYYFNLVLCC